MSIYQGWGGGQTGDHTETQTCRVCVCVGPLHYDMSITPENGDVTRVKKRLNKQNTHTLMLEEVGVSVCVCESVF